MKLSDYLLVMYSQEHSFPSFRIGLYAALTQSFHRRFAQDGPQPWRGAGPGGRGIVPWSGSIRLETGCGRFIILYLSVKKKEEEEKEMELKNLLKKIRQHTSM